MIGWRLSQHLRVLGRRVDVLRAPISHFDVIVVERELFDDETISMEQRFRDITRRMVIDIDDGIFLRHPEKFSKMMRLVDERIVGNHFLSEHVRNIGYESHVLPTCIDAERYQPRTFDADDSLPVVLGWTGTSGNFPGLRMIAPALNRIGRRFNCELHIIADRPPLPEELGLSDITVRYIPWQINTEIADLSNFDIGLMPLAETPWNQYKCGFKIIQYFGVGIPAVASPVGVNRFIIDDGSNGLLASSVNEWEHALVELITKTQCRRTLGAAARLKVEAEYSVHAHADRWCQLVLGAD